jgi:hypothetical protein
MFKVGSCNLLGLLADGLAVVSREGQRMIPGEAAQDFSPIKYNYDLRRFEAVSEQGTTGPPTAMLRMRCYAYSSSKSCLHGTLECGKGDS